MEAQHLALLKYASITIVLYSLYCLYAARKRTPRGYRPIPKVKGGLPIIGNVLQFQKDPIETIRQWCHEYGEIFEFSTGAFPIIMLGSRESVREVFDKQTAATSSRQPMPAFSDIISGGFRFLLMPYGQKWRQCRAIVHQATSPKASDSWRPVQEFEAKQLAHDILTRNEDQSSFFYHTRRYTTSVMMTVTYGKRMPDENNEDIKQVYKAMKDMGQLAFPRGFLVDLFPSLAKLPAWMQWWRESAKEYYYGQEKLWTKLYNGLLNEITSGTAPQCFVKHMVDEGKLRKDINDTQAAFVAGSMIEAGSETTAGLLNSIWKYSAANPEIQVRANRELTEVCGEDRSPTFDDMEKLRYTMGIVKEVVRFRPIAQVANAHYTTKAITYKDYYIPKDTMVGFSQYFLHFDDTYEEPYAFKPERYMEGDLRFGPGLNHPDPMKRSTYAFGAGRRICPGVHLAENSLFIVAAKILWAFKIVPATDEAGNEIPVDVSHAAYEDATIVVPKPFKVRFIPRSEHRASIVREEWAKAERDGYWLGDIKVDKNGMLSKKDMGK